MEKKLFFKFSDGHHLSNAVMELSGCMESIQQDILNLDDEDLMSAEYILIPIRMTDAEFKKLPEAES